MIYNIMNRKYNDQDAMILEFIITNEQIRVENINGKDIMITIPINDESNYSDYMIEWMPKVRTYNTNSYAYKKAGMYKVKIYGNCRDISSWDKNSSKYLQKVISYGTLNLEKIAFEFASILCYVPNYLPSTIKDVSNMFKSAKIFNSPIDKFDTKNIIDMSSMFEWAKNFNQSLKSFNTSKVTDMENMFAHTDDFNQPLNNLIHQMSRI